MVSCLFVSVQAEYACAVHKNRKKKNIGNGGREEVNNVQLLCAVQNRKEVSTKTRMRPHGPDAHAYTHAVRTSTHQMLLIGRIRYRPGLQLCKAAEIQMGDEGSVTRGGVSKVVK